VQEYASFGKDELKLAVQKIEKRLGLLAKVECVEAIERDDFEKAVLLILSYYDKAYAKGLAKREPGTIFSLLIEIEDTMEAARRIIQFARGNSII
jgi:tRNA 2-selenouridine synthase